VSDKNFKVKSGLNIPITSAAILTTDASGNISSTAVLPITAGGTGQTSATNAINALLPVQNGSTVNYALQSDGSNVNWGKLYNQTIKNNGTTVTPRGIVNVVGATFSDDSGTDTTTITFTDTTGVSTSGGSTITAASASTKGLIIKGAASQTANLTEWQTNAGAMVAYVDSNGSAFFNSNLQVNGVAAVGGGPQAYSQLIIQTNSATRNGLVIKAASSQTANLQEWQNNSGTVLASIDPNGQIRTPQILNTASFNNSRLQMTSTGSLFDVGVASNVALRVRGAASQTANLQEWQNSGGTVLAKVDSSGSMFTTTATAGTNTTQVATTEFVKTAIDNLIASAPGTLDTLDEIAQALNDDPNFYTTITTLTNALAEQDSYTLMGVF
jgi:hypothetical protein